MGDLKRTDRRAAAVGDTVGALGTGKTLELIMTLQRIRAAKQQAQMAIRVDVGRAGIGRTQANHFIVLKLTTFDPIVHVAETLSPAGRRRWHRACAVVSQCSKSWWI